MDISQEIESEEEFLSELQSKGITIQAGEIDICHPLPGARQLSSSAPTATWIVVFVRRSVKFAIFDEFKEKRPENVYINHALTPRRARLFKEYLWLKKTEVIEHVIVSRSGPLTRAQIRDFANLHA